MEASSLVIAYASDLCQQWLLSRFSIPNAAEKARQSLRSLSQSGKHHHLDAYCSAILNIQAKLGGGHDDELISAFIAGLRNRSAVVEI